MGKLKLIHCGKLFDGIHEELKPDMEILVKGNQILEVGPHLSRTPDTEEIDLSGLTVTPGMIDAHVHSGMLDWQTHWQTSAFQSEAFQTLSHLHTAQRCLERGFTTIRCMSTGFGVADVKRMIERGAFAGSRLHISVRMLGTPGSHIDSGQRYSTAPELGFQLQKSNIGSGPDFFRNAVRNDVKYGADFVKIFLSGGFLTPNDGPEDQQMDDDEIKAFCDTANALHKPSTAHVYAPKLMQKLIRYGITGMEHGALMDEETARLFEKTDTYLVPTFCPYEDIIELDEESLSKKNPQFRKKLLYYSEWLRESRKILVNSNIRMGYGTDFPAVHQCYEGGWEFACWLKSGMDPYRTLKAATSVNAGILRMDNIIGTIEPGKLADLAGWHRDVLTDPMALLQCDFVMKDGIVYPAVYNTQ